MTEGKGITLTSIDPSGLASTVEFDILCSACTHKNDRVGKSLGGVTPIRLTEVLKHYEVLLCKNKCFLFYLFFFFSDKNNL